MIGRLYPQHCIWNMRNRETALITRKFTFPGGCFNLLGHGGMCGGTRPISAGYRQWNMDYLWGNGLGHFHSPAEAGIENWLRKCRLLRSKDTGVEIEDDFQLSPLRYQMVFDDTVYTARSGRKDWAPIENALDPFQCCPIRCQDRIDRNRRYEAEAFGETDT